MAGDKFNIKVSSWYKTNGSSPGTPTNPLSDLLSALINGVSSISGGKYTATELNANNVFTPSVTDFLTNRSYATSKPKAYLNWILFDEQFKLVTTGSGAEQVGDDQEFKVHVKTNLPVTKNGYLYVYVSNETPNINVYFDNLQVTHTRGPLLEETHYYPFGLTMSGISSKSAGSLKNKEKTFQGQRFDDDFGLNWVQFKWRNHDPQIGRFIEIDPLSEKYVYNSLYAFSENRVTDGNELEGLEWKSIKDDKGVTTSRQLSVSITNNSDKITKKQFNKLVESFKTDFSKTFGADGAKVSLIVSDHATIKVELVDLKGTPIVDSDGNDAIRFIGGQAGSLGDTQNNKFSVTASVDGEKQSNSDMSRAFNHEAGHTAGLRHPFDPKQDVEDIKQGASNVKSSTVKKNLMNSDANPVNPSSSGKALTSGQFKRMDEQIQSQQPQKEL